jgi:hypothetical protein
MNSTSEQAVARDEMSRRLEEQEGGQSSVLTGMLEQGGSLMMDAIMGLFKMLFDALKDPKAMEEIIAGMTGVLRSMLETLANPDALKAGLAVSIHTADPELYKNLFKQDTEKSYVVVPGVGVVLKRDIDAADKAAANGVSGVTVKTAIPQAAIDRLKKNPGAKAQFDEIFGAGAAASVLGGGSGNATGGFRPEGN